jgi:predicted MPP superfamily phosphohydrolase
MIKHIIHISDLHVRKYMMHDMYENVFYNFIAELDKKLDGVDKETVRIVITGDIVHQKIDISNEQILIISNLLKELTEFGKIIIIPGNHDFLVNNAGRVDSITPIVELLASDSIIYYRDYGVYEDENINWVVYSQYQNNEKPEFTKNINSKYIGLYHGRIDGLSTDTGFVFEDVFSSLNFIDCDLILCGDIHKRQTFTNPDGGKGVMIGSFIQQGFGEKIKYHGFGYYNVETDEYTFHDVPNDEPFMVYKITDIKDIENGSETLTNLE